jgi:hypothetical protein
MDSLPFDTLLGISNNLDPTNYLHFVMLSRSIWLKFNQPNLWKKRCFDDFPWFFWGQCERLEIASMLMSVEPVDCSKECTTVFENPYHPLPKDYRLAYILIASGKYSGLLHYLSDEEGYYMSAYVAIATYCPPNDTMLYSTQIELISQYRRGVSFNFNEEKWNNEIEWKPRKNTMYFRRIPGPLLPFDPRELVTRDLFSMETSRDGRPVFIPGEEVEIQWKGHITNEYGWWRGFVVGSYIDPSLQQIVNEDGIELSNEPLGDGSEEGIQVLFPQYPILSPWATSIVSLFGIPRETEGACWTGGIRKVKCKSHSLLWDIHFKVFMEQNRRNRAQEHESEMLTD